MNENSAISPSRNDQWSGNTLLSRPRSGVAAWNRSSTPLPTFAGIWVMSSFRRFTAAPPTSILTVSRTSHAAWAGAHPACNPGPADPERAGRSRTPTYAPRLAASHDGIVRGHAGDADLAPHTPGSPLHSVPADVDCHG